MTNANIRPDFSLCDNHNLADGLSVLVLFCNLGFFSFLQVWLSSFFFCMLADLLQLFRQIWNVDDLVIGLFISEFESDGLQNLETLQKSQ
jgi:hypothetical protein